MKIVYPDINKVFNLSIEDKVNMLVIENQDLFTAFISDVNDQINGLEGRAVMSLDNNPVKISSNLEMISQYIPFDINTRTLITKLHKKFEDYTFNEKYFLQSNKLQQKIIEYLFMLSGELDFDVEFNNELNLINLFKAVELKFNENYNSISEQIIEYMKIDKYFNSDKCYILVNIRDYINDNVIDEFYKLILYNKIKVLIISGGDHPKSEYEEKHLIDFDLCEF